MESRIGYFRLYSVNGSTHTGSVSCDFHADCRGEGQPLGHPAHQGRSLRKLSGDGSSLLSGRCLWSAPDELAGTPRGCRLGGKPAAILPASACPAGKVGTLRAELEAKSFLRAFA